jgi:hypothetical protein
MVATVNATLSFMSTPSNERAGTYTIPPPIGTQLAKQAAKIPRMGMYQKVITLSLSMIRIKQITHRHGITDLRIHKALEFKNETDDLKHSVSRVDARKGSELLLSCSIDFSLRGS